MSIRQPKRIVENTFTALEAELYFKEQGFPCTVDLYNGGDKLYWTNPDTGELLEADYEDLVIQMSVYRFGR